MGSYTFKAVIFDLDGVVTQTAQTHALAWKSAFDEYLHLREDRDKEPFREFTHEGDYLPFVDGKPRYDGVRNFLESRDIHIPFGGPEDAPDKETICGIGNKKNREFLKILKEKGAEVYPSTIQLIKDLKKNGIRIGVASSSKNCKLILESTKIEELFETRVDGVVSEELGLKGKPEGDIFVTAAHNLGALPCESIVVEDASSGVMAGRNGGFGLVVGVARKNNEEELFRNCADVVVSDLSQVSIEWIQEWFDRRPRPLFESWGSPDLVEGDKAAGALKGQAEHKIEKGGPVVNPCYSAGSIQSFFRAKDLVFFLDYDGTLTPIVRRPELAVMDEKMRRVLKRLSEKYTVSVVSGRTREDVQKLVYIEGLIFAGSHGFDISMPAESMIEPRAEAAVPVISQVIDRLKKSIISIPGVLIEEKKFSVAVHFRESSESDAEKIAKEVRRIVKPYDKLRIMSGKKVFEILPDIDWDKGRAIRWIMQALGLSWDRSSVIYIGDDTTDEDAFRILRTRGTGVLVSEESKISAADFRLSSTDEVRILLEKIIEKK